jgi:hypothetical protein
MQVHAQAHAKAQNQRGVRARWRAVVRAGAQDRAMAQGGAHARVYAHAGAQDRAMAQAQAEVPGRAG